MSGNCPLEDTVGVLALPDAPDTDGVSDTVHEPKVNSLVELEDEAVTAVVSGGTLKSELGDSVVLKANFPVASMALKDSRCT